MEYAPTDSFYTLGEAGLSSERASVHPIADGVTAADDRSEAKEAAPRGVGDRGFPARH